jgi:hypothetical protein
MSPQRPLGLGEMPLIEGMGVRPTLLTAYALLSKCPNHAFAPDERVKANVMAGQPSRLGVESEV